MAYFRPDIPWSCFPLGFLFYIMNANNQEKIIKTSTRYWVQNIGAIILLSIGLPVAGIYYWGEGFLVVGIFAILVGIPYALSEVISAQKRQIYFSSSFIEIRMGGEIAQQPWESIQAVKFSGWEASRRITLFGRGQNLEIPCKYFIESELTNLLKMHLPVEAFHPLAYQKTRQFLDWQESVQRLIGSVNRTLRVSLGKTERWIGIFSICMGIFTASMFYFSARDGSGALFMGTLFGGLGLILLILSIGWIEGNNESITLRTLFEKHEFPWSRLRKIYINSNRSFITLAGDNENRLILPAANRWSGADKELLQKLITFKLESSKIEPIETVNLPYWRSKTS